MADDLDDAFFTDQPKPYRVTDEVLDKILTAINRRFRETKGGTVDPISYNASTGYGQTGIAGGVLWGTGSEPFVISVPEANKYSCTGGVAYIDGRRFVVEPVSGKDQVKDGSNNCFVFVNSDAEITCSATHPAELGSAYAMIGTIKNDVYTPATDSGRVWLDGFKGAGGSISFGNQMYFAEGLRLPAQKEILFADSNAAKIYQDASNNLVLEAPSGSVIIENITFYESSNYERIEVGTTNPLTLREDETINYIERDSGPLTIQTTTSGNMVITSAGELKLDGVSGVDLYFNNNKKVDVTDTGITVTGNISVTGTLDGVDIASLKTDVDGFPDELKNLAQAEIQQLENIGALSISATEWGYLAELDQSVKLNSSPTFSTVTASAGKFFSLDVTSGNTLYVNSAITQIQFNGTGYRKGQILLSLASFEPTDNGAWKGDGAVGCWELQNSENIETSFIVPNDCNSNQNMTVYVWFTCDEQIDIFFTYYRLQSGSTVPSSATGSGSSLDRQSTSNIATASFTISSSHFNVGDIIHIQIEAEEIGTGHMWVWGCWVEYTKQLL